MNRREWQKRRERKGPGRERDEQGIGMKRKVTHTEIVGVVSWNAERLDAKLRWRADCVPDRLDFSDVFLRDVYVHGDLLVISPSLHLHRLLPIISTLAQDKTVYRVDIKTDDGYICGPFTALKNTVQHYTLHTLIPFSIIAIGAPATVGMSC